MCIEFCYNPATIVNVERFKKRRRECNEGNIRKKLRRAAGGEIAVPCPETNGKVLKKLQEKVLSGEINVGELIVPRKVIKSQLYKIIRF